MRFRPHRPGRRASAAILTVIAVAAGSALTALPASADTLAPAPVHGAAIDATHAADAEATPGETPVNITVVLTPDDRDELRSIATTSEPTDAADVETVAPPAGHAPKVRAALEAAGFTVDADTDRWDLTATGTAADAEQLFQVHLVGAGEQMHPTSEPVMPAAFDGKATAVLGLDQRPVISPTAVPGTPASTIAGAYGGVNSPNAGAGTTVATVQFSGWNANDLQTYAKAAGKAMPSYTQISVDGTSTTKQGSDAGAFEVALDQQAILSVAPKAAQRVYFADNSVQGMYDAYSQVAGDVAKYGITTVSVSWLMCEPQLSAGTINVLEDAVDRVVASGATMFAASGDNGAKCVNGQTGVGYPASSPAVLSVGGTSLTKSGSTYRESAWGNSFGSTGGGYSSRFNRPAYQAKTGINSSRRQTPDIAALADPGTGPGIWSSVYGKWMLGGGTSLASPILAGQLAATLSNRGCSVGIGDIHTTLYANPGAFRDITSGGNGADNARRGYDLVTGLGSPNWGVLKNVLPKASGCQQRSPVGSIDAVSAGPGTVTVRGWTFDSSDSGKSIAVRVSVGGITAGTVFADGARTDVNKAKNITGSHGYSGSVKTSLQGRQEVCVTAINIGAGADSVLGCTTITMFNSSPVGTFDGVSATTSKVTVRGWVYDPDDTSASTSVRVTVGGSTVGTLTADGSRDDVNKAMKITGKHGYSGALTADKAGAQSVCIIAKNISRGADRTLGCRTVTIPSPNPTGTLDGVTGTAGAVTVRGWAFDPNSTGASLAGYITVGGTNVGSISMNGARADVNKAMKVTGNHGYNTKLLTSKTGKQSVCVVAKNVGYGSDTRLGCKTVTIADSTIRGSFDGASATTAAVTVRGWTFDTSSTSRSINAAVTIDGKVASTITANGARADVNRVKKVSGKHGFNTTAKTPVTAGKHSVCIISRNIGAGGDASLGCKTVIVAADVAKEPAAQ
ncbi:S53 family peptidase [Curtobacterium citreum]